MWMLFIFQIYDKCAIKAALSCSEKYNISKNTLLSQAIISNKLNLVKDLIEYGANIEGESKDDIRPLYRAVEKNSLKIVKYLVEQKADINANPLIETTALHVDTCKNYTKVTKYLIEQKADINIAHHLSSITPLHYIMGHGNLDILKSIPIKDIKLGRKDVSNNTPLSYAVKQNHFNIISYCAFYNLITQQLANSVKKDLDKVRNKNLSKKFIETVNRTISQRDKYIKNASASAFLSILPEVLGRKIGSYLEDIENLTLSMVCKEKVGAGVAI